MTTNRPAQSVTTLLKIAKPWVYRRDNGSYSLRVRPVGTSKTHTVSLRTTAKATAMSSTRHLMAALQVFHLDNPEATWPELKARLSEIAEGALATPEEDTYGLVLSDLAESLQEAARVLPLSIPQAKAITLAYRVLSASQARLSGDLKPLLGLLDNELADPIDHSYQVGAVDRYNRLSPPQSVGPHSVPAESPGKAYIKAPVGPAHESTFEALCDAYEAERSETMAPATLKNFRSSSKTLAGLLGALDMRTHTRADMVGVREALCETRKGSTVNKLLTHLSMVMSWAQATGLITHDYSKKLTITKGAESSRQAFTGAQTEALKAASVGHLASDWKGAAMALGVASGARIGEIHQLTGEDITKDPETGLWLMSINDNNGKTLKNKFSRRVVPLVGIPEATCEALAGTVGRLFPMSMSGFAQMLNQAVRDVLGTVAGEGLSFHSLRHSLATDLKASGCPVGTAQEILGHSSGSISYDLYGGSASADVARLAEALAKVR